MRVALHKNIRAEVLVTGLPGIGRVGHVAAAYLASKLPVERVATFYFETFPPQVIIGEDGVMRLFSNEVYYVPAERPFFLLTGDSQPVGSHPSEFYSYVDALLDFFKPRGVREIITMAGIDRGTQRFTASPGVVVAGSDADMVTTFKDLGAKVDEGGAITGAAGLLVGLGALRGIRGACLMGETSSQLTAHGDPTSAAAVLRVLSKYLGFNVDLSELDKAAETLDALLKKIASAPKEEEKKPVDYIR
ncbi:MAG: hypothetical protein GXN93_00845 [Candidatus Diapherotrites archaeon]|nr:hypothetical protein [Candidatus Diapherotrites archaeon]